MSRKKKGSVEAPRAVVALCAWRFAEPVTNKCILRAGLSGRYWAMEVWNDALISRARSVAASQYLRNIPPEKSDVLVFVDSDIVFDLEDIDKLVALCREHKGISCSAYPVRRGVDSWLAVRGIPGSSYAVGRTAEPAKVLYGSTGFLAIHRDVLKSIAQDFPLCLGSGDPEGFWPMFAPLIIEYPNGMHEYLSEDWSFCQRAIDKGFEVWVDGTIDVGHIGSYEYHHADVTESRSATEDQKSVIEDLAEYLGKTTYEIMGMVYNSGIWKPLADRWREMNPQTPQDVEKYYRSLEDEYLLDLANFNAEQKYWLRVGNMLRAQGKIIDFGGGIGSLSLALARRGATVTYVDLPGSGQRKFAEWRFRKHSSEFTIEVRDSLTGLKDYDCILAADVMEHIHPDAMESTCKALWDAVRPGGNVQTTSAFGQRTDDQGEECWPMHYDTAELFVTTMKSLGFLGGESLWLRPAELT